MSPLDVSLQDRQRAIQHMQIQLQQLQQPADKAASMASKVEEAAYNRATNKHEYMQFLQNSMKKAQAALHRQAHAQHQAAQHQAAQHQAAQQQAHAQQQAAQQQAAQQQQQAAIMAQQAQAQHQAAAQQQAIAQQQAAVQAQFMGQPQYMQQQQQQPAQPQYVQQPQQPQYVQQQAAQPQYVQQQAAPQQYMQQQAPAQQMYRQQAPAGQAHYMQHQVPQQPQYVQQQAAQPQPQYVQQPPAQQPYVQQPAPQQYMQQQPAQQQYMHQQAPQQHYAQQQVPPQHYVKQSPQAPQYMPPPQQQQQQQQQPQYMHQQPAHQAVPQPQPVHQPAPPQQPQYMPQQQAAPRQAQLYKAQAPVQHQQVPAQHQQQHYVQQASGSAYAGQQYGAAQAGAAMQQQPALQPALQPGQPPGLQPRQLTPGELARLPSFDDPAFGDFAAELFPDSSQAAVAPKLQQAPQVQPPRYAQRSPQQNAPSPSVAESSAPAPGRKASPGSAAAAREASSAAGAAGGRRPQQHPHDPQALQEFLRMHAAFNNPASRAQTIKDSERMLQFFRESGQQQPAVAERMAARVQRSGMILRLLMTDKPHLQLAITDQVLKFSKAFIRELAHFKEVMKRNSQKLATAGSAGSASTAATGSGALAGGFLAMMEAGESDALKFSGPLGTAAPPPGAVPAKPPAAAGAPTAAASAAVGQALPGQATGASTAATAAAEAARQQALARQRQLAEANAEQQRRREAAAAAAAALPAAGPPRLAAAAQQARSAADVATVQGGFRRLQKVLAASEQRLLGLSPPQGVSTPPLPAEVQRLVARERAAMEEAAAATQPGVGSGKGVVAAVLTEPCGEAHVAAAAERQQAGKAGAEGAGLPAAKRQRSASPEAAGAVQLRQRSQLELRLAAECDEVAAALGGALSLQVAPDAMEPRCVMVTCLPRAAQAGAADADAGGVGANGRPVPPSHQWQVLLLRVPPGYPEEAPTAVFPRMGHGGASEAAAAATARHQQLLDACRERFAASLARGPSPPALAKAATAWLDATQAVAAQAAGDKAA